MTRIGICSIYMQCLGGIIKLDLTQLYQKTAILSGNGEKKLFRFAGNCFLPVKTKTAVADDISSMVGFLRRFLPETADIVPFLVTRIQERAFHPK